MTRFSTLLLWTLRLFSTVLFLSKHLTTFNHSSKKMVLESQKKLCLIRQHKSLKITRSFAETHRNNSNIFCYELFTQRKCTQKSKQLLRIVWMTLLLLWTETTSTQINSVIRETSQNTSNSRFRRTYNIYRISLWRTSKTSSMSNSLIKQPILLPLRRPILSVNTLTMSSTR